MKTDWFVFDTRNVYSMSTSGWKINTGILCVNVHLQEREKQNALSQGSSSFSLEQLSNTCLTSLDFLILVLHVKSVDPSMNQKQEEGRIVVRTSEQFVYDTTNTFASFPLRDFETKYFLCWTLVIIGLHK